MPPIEKKFVLTHIIENVSSLKEDERRYSDPKEHFGVPWRMWVSRRNDYFSFYLNCEYKIKNDWSISIDYELRIVSVTGKKHSYSIDRDYNLKYSSWGWRQFIKWEEMEKYYIIDGDVAIEALVKINKMTGIEKKKLRNFDESMKMFSDIVLIVSGEKFYVSKLILSVQSTYFEKLFHKKNTVNGRKNGRKGKEESEMKLNDIDAKDFQNFLELIYGELAIDDESIDGILKLADMYDANLAVRKCEFFIIDDSEKTLKEKLKLASQYKLEDLKNSCLSKINTAVEIRSVLTCNLNEMDPSVLGILLQKALALIP